jgi:hypothetical protein
VQKPAMLHVELGISLDDLAFKFELHDGGCFVHAGHQ